MKKRYILSMILLAFVSVSCDKWLDVKPELDIYEETLFEKTQGYYVALNGLYIDIAQAELYGQELSWGAIEAWGRSYTLHETGHKGYNQIMKFEYDQSEAKSIGASIWLSCYKVIAEANNLIQNLEQDKEIKFKYGDATKNMILAEAYAIRAMMHFELVRIYAKAPIDDEGGVSSFVPYVTEYPSRLNLPIPTKELLRHLIADLEKAKEWVKPFDTDPEYPGYISYQYGTLGVRIKLDDGGGYSPQADDEFFRYRANRLSYFPITQLLARVCLYAGEKDKAYENANEIVTMAERKTTYNFVAPGYIGDPMTLTTVEPRLQTEMLFGSYNAKLSDLTEKYFGAKAGNYTLKVNDKVNIFSTNPNDVRLAAIPRDIITKYSLDGKVQDNMVAAKSLIPVLRFPECYYIAAESIFDKDKARAIELFNKVVEARNNAVYDLDMNVDKADFMEAIVREYRREFIGEGQMVYVYKRLNLPLRENGTTVPHNGKLVMPIPDSEAGLQ